MRRFNVVKNFLVVVEIRNVKNISMSRQPCEILQPPSFMEQGAMCKLLGNITTV
jgi:hypothetical protein